MPLDLRTMNPKGLKDPAVVALYQQYADDYLTAYRLHTDQRVLQDGPAAAIGGDWDANGARQCDFLWAQGLRHEDTVLDIGCGTGRLARHLVPRLDLGHYVGVDLSGEAIAACHALADAEGWATQIPRWYQTAGDLTLLAGSKFTIAWAYAVFIHLPTDVLERLIASLCLFRFERLYFTYKSAPEPCRSGLKQFAAPLSWYQETAGRHGFRVEAISALPYLPQAMGVLTYA